MELQELQELVSSDFKKLREKIEKEKKNGSLVETLKQYEPATHAIMDKAKRPDKTITTGEGELTTTKQIEVTRLAVSFQKKIVKLAAAFLCGNPIKLQAIAANDLEKDMLEVVKKTWEKNKLDYKSKELAKLMMSETEAAEIWYSEKADADYWANTPNEGKAFRVRMKIVANSKGDLLYPVFNKLGDMIAFGRYYTILVDGKEEEHFDIYTAQKTYLATKVASEWVSTEEPNFFKKIPVIYYSQPQVEWADVQCLIERFEKSISNHSDTNDYFGSPMVKVEGEVKSFSTKGESGKVLELANGANAEYMSWDQSPKSLELEFNNLRSLIHDMTDTPDISFDQMKGLGTFSGFALKMLFLAPHMKAADKEEIFGESIQRRINLLIDVMAIINAGLEKAKSIYIQPKFEYYLPKNEAEIVDMLVTATGSTKAIMSTETAVSLNPLVVDSVAELDRLKNEEPEVIEIP